jgi:type I restriction enzyme, S subunit
MNVSKVRKTDYKETSIGQIPEDWEVKELGQIGSFSKGKGILKEQLIEFGLPCIRYGEIYTVHDFVIKRFKSFISEQVAKQSQEIKKGDVLFAGSGETIEEIGKAVAYLGEDRAYAGGDVIILSTNGHMNPECLSYLLHTDVAHKQKRRLGQGQQVVHIYPSDLAIVRIPIPPFLEQTAIARLLSTWDNAIIETNELICRKVQRRMWTMQQLLSGKLRNKIFVKTTTTHKTGIGELPIDWKLKALKKIVNPVKKSVTPKSNELYQQIGIRSHTKGLFYKEKVTGKDLGDKSVFWIEPNCFVVNIVFAWEHAIAKTTDQEIGMIASHRFPMYKPVDGVLNLDYLLYYFKSARGKHLLGLASPGGAGRNKTLGQSEFLNLQIPVPSIEEQCFIAELLQAADKEIELLQAKLIQLKEQKKGLMQMLLTGKKRLKL